MRSGGGHSKGSAFERQVAKIIVKAFKKKGITQHDCWRSVLSGGHTISAGDLVMSRKLERLLLRSVECKRWRKIDWWHFLVGPDHRKSSWKECQWIKQAKEGAEKRRDAAVRQGLKYAGSIQPLLVMKENHGQIFAYGPYVGYDSNVWRLLPLSQFLKDTVEML